jgi:hypothetical protein
VSAFNLPTEWITTGQGAPLIGCCVITFRKVAAREGVRTMKFGAWTKYHRGDVVALAERLAARNGQPAAV